MLSGTSLFLTQIVLRVTSARGQCFAIGLQEIIVFQRIVGRLLDDCSFEKDLILLCEICKAGCPAVFIGHHGTTERQAARTSLARQARKDVLRYQGDFQGCATCHQSTVCIEEELRSRRWQSCPTGHQHEGIGGAPTTQSLSRKMLEHISQVSPPCSTGR